MTLSTSSSDLLPPYELFFSCAICQKSISEIYNQSTRDKGLNDGSNEHKQVATKLWLTECSHVTCGEHLKGGGVPFHPTEDRPRASCPVCAQERGDLSERKIYGIIGPNPGEHDVAVPAEYFETPPGKSLNGSSHESRALKFQYLSMLRYGRTMHQRIWEMKCSAAAVDTQTKELFNTLQKSKEDQVTLQEKIKSLEIVEKKYNRFKEREPEIKHYLGQFACIARENGKLKEQLLSLGYDVPRTVWSMSKPPKAGETTCDEPTSHTNGHSANARETAAAQSRATANGQFAQNRLSTTQCRSSSSSRKRTHDDYLEHDIERLLDETIQQEHVADYSMPPPPFPTQRVSHTPVLAEHDQINCTPSRQYQDSSSNVGVRARRDQLQVQVYQDSAWNDGWNGDARVPLRSSRPYPAPKSYLMSGAIGAITERGTLADHRELEHDGVRAVPQPRFTRPAPKSPMEIEAPLRRSFPQPVKYSFRYRQEPESVQGPMVTRIYSQQMENRSPSRAASRSSFSKQPLMPAVSRGNVHGPDSGYLSNFSPDQLSSYVAVDKDTTPGASRHSLRMTQAAVESPFFKPHFNGPISRRASPKYRRSSGGQSEQLDLSLRQLRMEPAAQQTRVRPSLNALSFIDEPYTSTNQPIYAQQQQPFSSMAPPRDPQPFRPAVIPFSGFIEDPRVSQPRNQPKSIRLRSAVSSLSQPHAQSQLLSASMVGPIEYATRPSTNSYARGGGFYPRNGGGIAPRGLFSAGGRRSVRR